MKAAEIRSLFVDFFKSKNHVFIPSSPLIPFGDPTLLFTNSGMNQFKNIFLGKEKTNTPRVANYQKCLRVSGKHNDLEDVGFDTYHHTFFEMLGNWSFGDYYKKEAIRWAWELFTEKLKLPKEKLYATIYYTDEEAFELWQKETDIPKDRILRFKEKENFWEMGETGPCGPCSEIHIDLGEEACDKKGKEGHSCRVNGDCGRFIELWNLVFIQYNRNSKGELEPLSEKHVDTGAGLERLVAVMQGKKSNYDTDLFQPIIQHLVEKSKKKYEGSDAVAMRVIADHIRALCFAISDGVIPSNEGRGYVIRRILRRAFRYGKKLGFHQPFLYQIVDIVVKIMGEAYPELSQNKERIQKMIQLEEERFAATLDKGLELFEKSVSLLKNNVFSGKEAFILYDTYGFPLDLTELLCKERGLILNVEEFHQEMEKQKEKARESAQFKMDETKIEWKIIQEGKSEFVGYEKTEMPVTILKYAFLEENKMAVVLAQTPFYAQSGGQVADTGIIEGKRANLLVFDVQKIGDDIVHFADVEGNWDSLDTFYARVDTTKRNATKKNHTATHLLQKALQIVVGKHIQQAGSLVEPERLRFDFSHFEKLTEEQITRIEYLVNEEIQKAKNLKIHYMSLEEAKKKGAMALFDEKYGEKVRVIEVPDFSMELCGGTHVENTGEIGVFKIVSESSVASGVRRIEAITGLKAFSLLSKSFDNQNLISKKLNITPEEIANKIEEMQKEIKKLKKGKIESENPNRKRDLQPFHKIKDKAIYIEIIENVEDSNLLKQLHDQIKSKEKEFIALLFGRGEKNIFYVIGVDKESAKKLPAGNLAKEINQLFSGRGGGKELFAQGTIEKWDRQELENWLHNMVKKI